jgi:RDD family
VALSLDLMTGFAQPFPNRRVRSRNPYENGTVVAYHGDSLEFALNLAPFCVWKSCPKCSQHELFYLHQRKKRKSYYFSFSTGHHRVITGENERTARHHITAMHMEPPGSVRAAAASGWRAVWPDLAPRPRRLAARTVDLAAVAALAALAWFITDLIGLSTVASAVIAVALVVIYEPTVALSGGTPGKRLLRIEPISIWTGRTLSRGDTLRRALFADAQLLVPPLAVYNLAWLLFDPARQCLHDRRAASIVIAGRTRLRRRA